MGTPVVNRPIDQVEDLTAEYLSVTFVGRKLAGWSGSGAGAGAAGPATTRNDESEGEGDAPGNLAYHSIANSRLNTTSKLNVLLLLRASMYSAIRLSRAGIPMIFSWAFRPSSLRPSKLSIFQ
jgi:hypothetical protein